MSDWYTAHLYKIYEAKHHEKFHRKSLPQWIGWNNKYNQSLNYEVYDVPSGVFIKRIMPKKIPKVMEFSFIDNNNFLNTGLCIYRQEDKLYWFSLIFGTVIDRDDIFFTLPAEYEEVTGLYYAYIHDVRVLWNETKIIYIFTVLGPTQVYAVDAENPDKIYKIDMSAISDSPYNFPQTKWICDEVVNPSLDIRLSDTAIEGSTTDYIGSGIGIHKCFYWTGGEGDLPTYSPTRIASVETVYNEDNDDLMFKTNLPLTFWWRNRPSSGSYPPLDGEDEKDFELSTLPYQYTGPWASGTSYITDQIVFFGSSNYKCISNHTASALNAPDHIPPPPTPWVQFEFAAPLGTAGYSYAVGTVPTGTLEYEWVSWRSDADREWLVGDNAIIVRIGGGFAYILLC